MRRLVRALPFLLGLVLILGSAGAVGYRLGLQKLREEAADYLGGGTEIGQIRLTLSAVEVHDVRIPGGEDWPEADELTAGTIRIVPSIGALLGGQVAAGEITVEEAHLSVVRTSDGKLRVAPSVLEAASDTPPMTLDKVRIRGATASLWDYSTEGEPARLRLRDVEARLAAIHWPALDTRTYLTGSATVVGTNTDGAARISGWVVPATQEANLDVELTGVDLVTLQPYLRRAGDARIERGTLDLDMTARVEQKVLTARGEVTWADLEVGGTRGVAMFMGIPAQAVMRLLADHQGRFTMKFVAEERIDDPDFRVHALLARTFRKTLAEHAGVDLSRPLESVSELGARGAESAADVVNRATEEAGRLVDDLLGN